MGDFVDNYQTGSSINFLLYIYIYIYVIIIIIIYFAHVVHQQQYANNRNQKFESQNAL